MVIALRNVRFWGQSGHRDERPECLLLTQSGHHAQVASRPPLARSYHCGLRALFKIAERRQIRCTELIQQSAQFIARITEHGEVSPLNHHHEAAAEVLREPL